MFWLFRSQQKQRSSETVAPELLDDSALIRRAQQRDSVAFGVLYERYLDRVYRYIVYKINDVSLAEDLTSEVFLNAWKAINRYEDRGHAFSTWLLRLAHNEVTDHYRTHRATVSLPETDTHSSSELDPEQFAELQSDQQTLLRAVKQLPEEWQQVILLRFVESVPFEDIAVIVGKSSGACRVIQHRALARLRELLSVEENIRGNTSI